MKLKELPSNFIIFATTSQFVETILKQNRDNLDLRLEQVESLISNLSGEETITEVLTSEAHQNNSFDDLATKARIGYTLNSFLNLKGLVSIDLLSVNGNAYHVGDTLQFIDTNKELINIYLNEQELDENKNMIPNQN